MPWVLIVYIYSFLIGMALTYDPRTGAFSLQHHVSGHLTIQCRTSIKSHAYCSIRWIPYVYYFWVTFVLATLRMLCTYDYLRIFVFLSIYLAAVVIGISNSSSDGPVVFNGIQASQISLVLLIVAWPHCLGFTVLLRLIFKIHLVII